MIPDRGTRRARRYLVRATAVWTDVRPSTLSVQAKTSSSAVPGDAGIAAGARAGQPRHGHRRRIWRLTADPAGARTARARRRTRSSSRPPTPSGISSTSTRPSVAVVVEPNRRAERPAGVLRERHERAALLVLAGEPRDRDVAAARAQHRAVDRARGDLPAIVVHGLRLGPCAVLEPRDVDVANLLFGCDCGTRQSARRPSPPPLVGQHSHTRSIDGTSADLLPVAPERREPHAHCPAAAPWPPCPASGFMARPSSHTRPRPAPGI